MRLVHQIQCTNTIDLIDVESGETITIHRIQKIESMNVPHTINTANDMLKYLIGKYEIINYMSQQSLHCAIWNACSHLTDGGLTINTDYHKWNSNGKINVDPHYIGFLSTTTSLMRNLPSQEIMLLFKFLFVISGQDKNAYVDWFRQPKYNDQINSISITSISQNIIDCIINTRVP